MADVIVGYLHPGEVAVNFHRSLVNLLVRDAYTSRRVAGSIARQSGANVSAARNAVVGQFLEGSVDWLWMVDSDMGFDEDALDRLLEAADPAERPIVGGLCFMVDERVWPTIYELRDGRIVQWADYPREQLVRCHGTGAACLLVHRSVFEKIESDHPFRWFRESALGDVAVSEDLTFCLQALQAGFPIFVDTRVKTTHQKTRLVDERTFNEQEPVCGT